MLLGPGGKFFKSAMGWEWGADLKVADWWKDGQWNIPLSFRRRYTDMAQAIMQVQLNPTVPDKPIWKLSKNVIFSIASC